MPRAFLTALVLITTGNPASLQAAYASTLAEVMTRYHCSDGSDIAVLYRGADAAVLTLGKQTIGMASAVSADGSRYVGGGWQWWAKGMRNGTLAHLRPGEDIASEAGVACSAR